MCFGRKKQKVPSRPKSGRDKLGGGRSPRALSRCNRLAPAKAGRLLPDAILRDVRSCRPHSRAVQGLATLEFLGEVYLPAQPVVAATDLWTRLGHASITFAS